MNETVFRKKSLDKMKSPENLDDYIQVSNPGVWLLLACVIVLLIGACIWGAFGQIDSTVPTTVCVENAQVTCRVAEEDLSSVRVGLIVRFAGTEALITGVEKQAEGGCLCTLFTGTGLVDGYYDGRVVIESYKPSSFILN